ncbi:MAG: serine/threonine protein phosphatase [Bacteroidales bacterium]|nr:serine/threonine protein phosphatase [Bacteroidales bacterium]
MIIKTKKYKRRFVISDVHGCSNTLKKLIELINLQTNDVVFFLGDYIDKGPNSVQVLDFIIELRKLNYNIFTLRGNHEQDFLNMSVNYDPDFFYSYVSRKNGGENFFTKFKQIESKYVDFFQNTHFYFELEDFFLVHAGFKFFGNDFLKDTSSMLELRYWNFSDLKLTNGKRIIHGHDPTNYEIINRAVQNKSFRIPLDNGCVYTKLHKYYDYTKLGKLCCIELNSWTLTCVKNEKDIVLKTKNKK